jgi:hypothetical protein
MELRVRLSAPGSLSTKTLSSLTRGLRHQVALAVMDEFAALHHDLSPKVVRGVLRRHLDFEVRRFESGSWELVVDLARATLVAMIVEALKAAYRRRQAWSEVPGSVIDRVRQVRTAFAENLTRRLASLEALGRLQVVVAESSFVEYASDGRPVLQVSLELAPRRREPDVRVKDSDELHEAVLRILEERGRGS